MKIVNKKLLSFGLLSAAILLSGCSSIKLMTMEVDPELATNGDNLTTSGRSRFNWDAPFTLGEYMVHKIDKDWTRHSNLTVVLQHDTELKNIDEKTKYEFTLDTNRTEQWLNQCIYYRRGFKASHQFSRKSGSSYNTKAQQIMCNFKSSSSNETIHLGLAKQTLPSSPWVGYLTLTDDKKIRVTTSYRTKDIAFGQKVATGFDFYDDETLIAQVETIQLGDLWIRKDIDDKLRTQLVTASSALMLHGQLGAALAED